MRRNPSPPTRLAAAPGVDFALPLKALASLGLPPHGRRGSAAAIRNYIYLSIT